MTSITSNRLRTTHGPLAVTRSRLFGLVEEWRAYRRKRAIYLRTLDELNSYRPHELADLRIHTGDFEELARQQAGW
jgi:uncharacterized protein YjiS (DUF1127 family)